MKKCYYFKFLAKRINNRVQYCRFFHDFLMFFVEIVFVVKYFWYILNSFFSFFRDAIQMENQRVQTYKCFYCATKFDTINNIVEHCQDKYQQNVLKYRPLILDERSGVLKYQTKLHEGTVPHELEKSVKSLCIQNNLIFIFDNVSKRKRLNTPVKENCRKNLLFETQSDYAIASDLERNIIDIDDSLISSVKKLSCADKASNKCDGDDEQGEDSELLQDLYSMLPIVLRNLEEVG